MKVGLCCIVEAWAENRLRFRCERRPYHAESVMVEANVRAESVIFAIGNDQEMR